MKTQKTSLSYHAFSPSAIAERLMDSMDLISAFAAEAGYQHNGDFPGHDALLAALQDCSHNMKKRLVKWHFSLRRKLSVRSANRFLHFVCVKLLDYGSEDELPRIDFSVQELAIQSARAAWVQARDEAEALRLAYATEKGDFYKL